MFPESEISPSRFTCTASSSLSKEDLYTLSSNLKYTPKCENVYTSSKYGWFTNGTGEGSWIKIEFNGFIRISKIIYRHNDRIPGKCCNQNFKEISFHFSDGTMGNVTLDDAFGSDPIVDFHYRIDTPKLSSHLRIMVNSVYDHYRPASNTSFETRAIYDQNRFGFLTVRVFGKVETGKTIKDQIFFIGLNIDMAMNNHIWM